MLGELDVNSKSDRGLLGAPSEWCAFSILDRERVAPRRREERRGTEPIITPDRLSAEAG